MDNKVRILLMTNIVVALIKHKPHDTRHTFINAAKAANMNEYVLKIIVGHVIEDVTEAVYTHRTVDQLREELIKIDLPNP